MNKIINFWDDQIKGDAKPPLIEAAFFQIYITYESKIRDAFIQFSIGKSFSNFVPSRKLLFESQAQLFNIIKGEAQFVDYSKAIPRCSKLIFIKNPFDLMYETSDYAQEINQLIYIRNYIAHKSQESKNKYIGSVLGAYGITDFEEPGDFLVRIKKQGNKSYYSFFVEKMKEITELFSNDLLLNNFL